MRVYALRAIATLAVVLWCLACNNNAAPSPQPTPTPQPPVVSIPAGLSPVLQQMLNGLASYITSVLAENIGLLPANPGSATQIQSKITALQNASLRADIINGQRWAEGAAQSSLGPAVPVATVFMLEPMRADAAGAVGIIEAGLPRLEGFMNTRFPVSTVRIWYGFKVGNSGGGGQIYTEDRATYVSRTSATRKPHDAILLHELSHSYISNECLNQFLEYYLYNLAMTGSVEFDRWIYKENSIPGASALFEVYQLIGHDAMRDAYRAVYPLRPPYGSPLSQAVIDAFLTAVPSQHRAAVSVKLATITF